MTPLYELNRFNFSSQQNVTLSEAAKKSALVAIKNWQKRDRLSLVTRLVALDCVVDPEGKLKIFSFDRRPQGFDLLKLYKDDLKSFNDSSEVAISQKENYHNSPSDSYSGIMFPDHPSAIFEEQLNASLTNESAGPRNFNIPHNDYGAGWLWQPISFGSHEEIMDFNGGFSLKAIDHREVFVCPPANKIKRLKKEGIRGARTVSQMVRKLEEHRTMYYQPYIEPLKSPTGYPMIYSLYFKYEPSRNRYIYLGGLSIARQNLNVVLDGEGVIFGVID